MEEIDIDPEDMDELEAKLYAQQHHEAVEEFEEGLDTFFESLDTENMEEGPRTCRYWNKGMGGVPPNPRYSKINVNPCAVVSGDYEEGVEAGLDIAAFRPYTPYLNFSGAIPNASGEGPNPEGSNEAFEKDRQNAEKRKNYDKQPETSNRMIREKMTKLDKTIKMQMKKFKANLVRQKRSRNIETIVIDSSSGDESDIVEIPMPPPPMVNLDSSAESEDDEKVKESRTSLKTEPSVEPKSRRFDQRNSRCNSPNSVVSDDFIAHADQTRLLEENVPDDEDLICIQETVDLVCQNQVKRVKPSHCSNTQQEKEDETEPNFITPRKKICKNMTSTPNYQVTQSSFRATDVYESESSDMPETVYSKGRNKGNEKSIQIDSNSDIEVDIPAPKAKRLRKRKAPGSNKGSEHNDDSSDEEDNGNSKPSLPFIARGEAVENNKEKPRRRSKSSRTEPISDSEFLTIINKISQGKNSNETASDKSVHSEEEITARKIAEDVLNKKKKDSRASRNLEPQQEIEICEDNDDAIPETSLSNIEKVLDKIDVLCKDKESSTIIYSEDEALEDHFSSEEDQMMSTLDSVIEEKIQITEKRLANKRPQQSTPENQLSVVFANNVDFGWSEEMKRFYHSSWGQEAFNVSRIKKTMDTNAKWTVYTQDRITKISKFSRLKCFNCCEFGHHRSKCPKPRRPLVCSMCGEIGHREPRCPYTCCLRVELLPPHQRQYLLDEIKVNYSVLEGMFTPEGAQAKDLIWENIKRKLNTRGDLKSITQWKKCWIDLKVTARKRYRQLMDERQKAMIAGLVDPKFELTNEDKAIIKICGMMHIHDRDIPNEFHFVENKCGNKTRVFTKSCNECSTYNKLICPICKIRGHNVQTCPDKWRRYHSTTKVNEYPSSKLIANKRKFCCICAGHGHLSEHCKSAVRFLEYPASVSEIRSYAKSYEDVLIKNSLGKDVIGYNLLYEPDDRISFRFTKKVTLKQCYGRFLKAVGLNYFLTKQPMNEEEHIIDPARNVVVNPFANDQKLLNKLSSKKHKLNKSNSTTTSADDIVLNVSTNESNFKYPKPPKMLKNSSSVIQENTDTLTVTPTTQSQTTIIQQVNSPDSNSNYSFSEHFDEQGKSIRKLGALPDYIPLGDDDDIQDDLAQTTFSESVTDVSRKLSQGRNSSASEEESNTKTICDAKIYLSKFHSRYLLSPDGNKLLTEMSKAYDVKTSIDWTSVGNTLIIEGDSAKQDEFHNQLLEVFRNLSENLKRKELERSQRIPRKRETLIRFLQENILQLENKLGNVKEIDERLKSCRSHYTKSSWKLAEKLRRSLNMILIGQAGLSNGKELLQTLQNQLKSLINDTGMTTIPEDLRNEIEKNWRIIFTSQQQSNYETLIETYQELKKKNKLSKPALDYTVLGKNVLNVTLTNEQKQKMEKKEIPIKSEPKKSNDINNIKTEPQADCEPEKTMPRSSSAASEKTMEIEKRTDYEPEKTLPKSSSAVSEKIMEIDKRWENRRQNLLDGVSKDPPRPRNARKAFNKNNPSSVFWSRECIGFIDLCLRINTGSRPLREKLMRVQDKAINGLLSYNDYRALVRIYNTIRGKK